MAGFAGYSPRELVFTSGGTEANNLALFGLPLAGKHVIASTIEHPSVLEPCRQLAGDGVRVSFAAPDFEAVAAQIRPDTILVSVMHANNETGAIQDIARLAAHIRQLRAAGQQIYLHSDGVQAFGKLDVQVSALCVDLYSVSAHKVHGPKGIGALYVRQGTPLQGIQLGGRHERERRAGTEDVPAAMAFARAVELLAECRPNNVKFLRDRFEDQVLSALGEVEVNARHIARLPNTSSLLLRGVSGETVLIALDGAGFAVSTGSACSSGSVEPSHVLLAMGLTTAEARGSVRFSFARYNTVEEVDRLSEAVVSVVRRIRQTSSKRSPQLVAS